MIGLARTGVERFVAEISSIAIDNAIIEPHIKALRQRAADALKKFEATARQKGVTSTEQRMVDGEILGDISVQARCCDLVVLGQPDPDESGVANPSFPEHIVMNSGVPAVIVPFVCTSTKLGDNALVAWNASVEATRAVHYAVPALRRAKSVKAAVFNPASLSALVDDPPGSYLERFLARHNINAEIRTATTDGNVGDALLALAGTLASDYLVMGCYGHSRFREVLLGGATANVLASAPIPVLMAH
jgi:nucleotide-binding universal stress UspA family protein